MYIYIRICIYIYQYIYIYTYIYVYKHMCILICMNIYIYIYIYVYMYIYIYIYVIYISICVYIYTNTYMQVPLDWLASFLLHQEARCIWVSTIFQYILIYIYIYIHTHTHKHINKYTTKCANILICSKTYLYLHKMHTSYKRTCTHTDAYTRVHVYVVFKIRTDGARVSEIEWVNGIWHGYGK